MLQRYGTAASQRKTDAAETSRVRNTIRGSFPLRGKLRLLALTYNSQARAEAPRMAASDSLS